MTWYTTVVQTCSNTKQNFMPWMTVMISRRHWLASNARRAIYLYNPNPGNSNANCPTSHSVESIVCIDR